MSGGEMNQGRLPIDNGKNKEREGSSALPMDSHFVTDEPERYFNQRKKEAQELAAKEAATLNRRTQEEYAGEEQFAHVNNPLYAPIDNPQYARNNPLYAPINNQGYARRQQYMDGPSMKDMSVPQLGDQTWCIDTNTEEDEFEVKTGVVHYLPKFAGLPGEVAIRHLKEFEGVCKTLKPYAAPEDRYKLKVFPFSLTDIAKSWFLSLPSGSIRTWEQMQRRFLDKFYPAAKASKIRRELSVIKQGPNESTYDYLERFTGLEQSCCNLGIPEKMLVEYLLDGLRPLERMMLDAAAGGSVMNLSPGQVRELIRETAESARFREETTRREETGKVRNISQVDTSENPVTSELKELKEMMRRMMVAQVGGVKACEFCNASTHRTDECPTLHSDNIADVNVMGGFLQHNNQPTRFGLAANGYSWKESGFNGQQQQNQQQQPYQTPHQRQGYPNHQRREYNQAGPSNVNQGKSVEDMVRELATTVGTLAKKVDQLATAQQQLSADVSELKKEKGRLPSQTVQNPKCGVNSITLRSGKALGKEQEDLEEGNSDQKSPPLPFPMEVKKHKNKMEMDEDLLKLFSKVEITIPLTDAIKHIPRYAKFLKEMCTTRRGGSKAEEVYPKQIISAIHNRGIEPKCEDQGTFTISCIIGNTEIDHCMLDLGSCINVMPYSLYQTLNIGPLQPTQSLIQLANKSCTELEGVLVNVIVRVQDLEFFADFYVLKNDTQASNEDTEIILGRPFLATAKAKINTWTGKVSMQAHGKKVSFYNYDTRHDLPNIAGNLVIKGDQKTITGCDVSQDEDVAALGVRGATKVKEKAGRTVHEPGEVMKRTKKELNVIKVCDAAKADDGKEELAVFKKKGPDKGIESKAPP